MKDKGKLPIPPSKSNGITVRLTLPKEVLSQHLKEKLELNLQVSDVSFAWLDVFRKHKLTLFNAVGKITNREDLRVMDNRDLAQRKVWKLSNTVKQFIDSFGRNQRIYNATLKAVKGYAAIPSAQPPKKDTVPPMRNGTAKTPMSNRNGNKVNVSSPKPGPSGVNQSNGLNNSKRPSQEPKAGPSSGTKKRKQSPPPHVPSSKRENVLSEGAEMTYQIGRGSPQIRQHLFIDDDAASMANSQDSQDSQDDLISAGIDPNKQIKSQIVTNLVGHVDNVTMLRIQKELKDIHRRGRWMKLAAKIPITANALQLIFLGADSN